MATDRQRWNEPDWQQRREKYKKLREYYEGKSLSKSAPMRDGRGHTSLYYPLKLNLQKLACDIHRDVARGEPSNMKPLVVEANVDRKFDGAELLDQYINEMVWEPSHGGPIQQEALLHMNIYGGTAFKLSWEPWNEDYPLGLGVKFIRDPGYILPVWDPNTPYRMVACWLGYQIDNEVARVKYGIEPDASIEKPLYMEYWSTEEWRVQIDEKVPTMVRGDAEYRLEGENPWGIVPFYYVPHDRSTELYGDSQIEDGEELNKEFNSRLIGLSDLAGAIKANVYKAHDIQLGSVEVKPIYHDGKVIAWYVDMGSSRPIAGSKVPDLEPLGLPDIPDGVFQVPAEQFQYWMSFNRIASVLLSMDSTASGRITGPVSAQRAWSSTGHATTERINFSDTKSMLDRDIVKMLGSESVQAWLNERDIDVDVQPDDYRQIIVRQSWPPQMPVDKRDKSTELVQRVQEKIISPKQALREWGTQDPDKELDEIEDWAARLAIIEALTRPTLSGGNSESSSQSQGS